MACPRTTNEKVIVSTAGLGVVNGVYRRDGSFDGVQKKIGGRALWRFYAVSGLRYQRLQGDLVHLDSVCWSAKNG